MTERLRNDTKHDDSPPQSKGLVNVCRVDFVLSEKETGVDNKGSRNTGVRTRHRSLLYTRVLSKRGDRERAGGREDFYIREETPPGSSR